MRRNNNNNNNNNVSNTNTLTFQKLFDDMNAIKIKSVISQDNN